MRADVIDIYHGDNFDSDMHHATSIADDLAKVKAFGIRGFIHKATQGVTSHDAAYPARRKAIEAAGFLFGAYDFNTGDPVKQQVDYFFKIAEPDIGPTGKMLCALDWEDNTHSQMSLGQCLDYLELADAMLGRRFALYGGNRIKALIVQATAEQRAFLGSHLLWGCQYGPRFKMVDDNGHGLPWSVDRMLWQFTGDGFGPGPHVVPGIATRNIDLNTFTGDPAELATVWAGAPLDRVVAPVVSPAPQPAAPPPVAAPPRPPAPDLVPFRPPPDRNSTET